MTKKVNSEPTDRSRQKADRRRAQILEAATSLLLEEGYASFSMRGVASRAHMRLSHVQYYFPESALLIAALLDKFMSEYALTVTKHFNSGGSAPEMKLKRALSFLFSDNAYLRDCVTFMGEVSTLAARDQGVAAALTKYYAAYFDTLQSIMRDLSPGLSESALAKRTWQCIAFIEGLSALRSHTSKIGRQAFSVAEAAQAILRIVKDQGTD